MENLPLAIQDSISHYAHPIHPCSNQIKSPPRSKPPPRYQINQSVARRSRPQRALHISESPHWCKSRGQWKYPYEYGLGFTSEGSAFENELMLAPPNSVF